MQGCRFTKQVGSNLIVTAAAEMSFDVDHMGVRVWREPAGEYVRLALIAVAEQLASV